MAALYILASLVVLVINAGAFRMRSAMMAIPNLIALIRFGVARGVFSNEAGLVAGRVRDHEGDPVDRCLEFFDTRGKSENNPFCSARASSWFLRPGCRNAMKT